MSFGSPCSLPSPLARYSMLSYLCLFAVAAVLGIKAASPLNFLSVMLL